MLLNALLIQLLILIPFSVSHIPDYTPPQKLYPILNEYVKDLYKEFRDIPEERRFRLNEIANYIQDQKAANESSQLLFISSNQSSIGQLIQIWAEAASYYYGLEFVKIYSGGLSPQAISRNTIHTLERAGFIIYSSEIDGIEIYKAKYSYNLQPVQLFPKKIDYRKNPRENYMAVVVEASADLSISRVRGTHHRLSLPYDDPLGYDGSEMEDQVYDNLCRKIALEMFYVFSQLKHI